MHIISCIEADIETLETMIDVFKKKHNDEAEWNSLVISIFSFLAEKILKLLLLQKSPLLLNFTIEPQIVIESLQNPGAGYHFKPSNWIGMEKAIERVLPFHDIQPQVQILKRMATIRNGHVHCFHLPEKSKVSRFLFNEQVLKCIQRLSEIASESCPEYIEKNFDDRLSAIEIFSEYSWEAHDIQKKMELAKKQLEGGRSIEDTLKSVYGFNSLGAYSYKLGDCPNCKETVNVIIDIESTPDEDEGDGNLPCMITAVACTECGFAADSSDICRAFNEDFDETDYQEECLSVEYERNTHGEIEAISISPANSYRVARLKDDGYYTSWAWDF